MKHVVAVHLLNDRSGSPLVLRTALEALVGAGYEVDLLTGTPAGETGFLSGLVDVAVHPLPYRWSPRRWLTLLRFFWVQALIFGRVLHMARPGSVVYVNSLLPFGAALAGRLLGARVVYHLHEVSIRPALLKRLLCAVANLTADRALFVSQYVQRELRLRVPRQQVVYNALPAAFVAEARAHAIEHQAAEPFVVLMACSLKDYKGVPEFVQLAAGLPALRFELVLNAPAEQVRRFRAAQPLPDNLTVFAAKADMHPFYQRAAVVLNLSRPTEWVETFGMTILEALQYGRPVIVPPVGGVSEVSLAGHTGFALDGRDLPALRTALELLRHCPRTYARFSQAGRQRAAEFAPQRFAEQIRQVFAAECAPSPAASSPVAATAVGTSTAVPARA